KRMSRAALQTKPGRSDDMSDYATVVVGTDGSDTSLRAVDRAGEIAAESNAKLIIAMGGEGILAAHKSAAILREARDRAAVAGATNIEEHPIRNAPVDALVNLAEEVKADLAGGREGGTGPDLRAYLLGPRQRLPQG